MAIERIEWQCPQCERRYAIPANLPRPTSCPKCQPDDEQAAVPAVTQQSDSTFADSSNLEPPLRADVEFEAAAGERDAAAGR